jgi:NAD(P)-dependent dehydrogenase (short-subunit alcohol dehydrogenase family)
MAPSTSEIFSIVTGATAGTGLVTARELARAGHTVTMIARNPEKAQAARESIVEETGNDAVDVLICDLAQVRETADVYASSHPHLDVLVNNAGSFGPEHEKGPQGFGHVFTANYLAPYLLTSRLLPLLEEADAARVVNLGSAAHHAVTLDFTDLDSSRLQEGSIEYPRAKLALTMHTFDLAARLRPAGKVTVNAVHPGLVQSGFIDEAEGLQGKAVRTFYDVAGISAEEGAKGIVHLATSPEVIGVTGQYFSREKLSTASTYARRRDLQERLWMETERRLAPVLAS